MTQEDNEVKVWQGLDARLRMEEGSNSSLRICLHWNLVGYWRDLSRIRSNSDLRLAGDALREETGFWLHAQV